MAQRREWKESVSAGTTKRILNYVCSPQEDYTLTYQLKGGPAKMIILERGESDTERSVDIGMAHLSAGRVRVQGAVEVSIQAEVDCEIHFAILKDAPVEPVPPLDAPHSLTDGTWADIGPNNGWCVAERYTFCVYCQGSMLLRFVDRTGAVHGQWTVTGTSGAPILHPPRMKLQAQPAAVGTFNLVIVYR